MKKLQIKKGIELTSSELDVINTYRKQLFNSETIWTFENMKDLSDDIFFILRDSEEIVSFCRFRNITIEFDNTRYDIYGLATVISVIQGRGYGKTLMKEAIKYANGKSKTVIGFCDHKNSEFYTKSGFQIIPKGNLRFLYRDEEGQEISDDGDMIYLEGNDHFIERFLEKKNLFVYHNIPHW